MFGKRAFPLLICVALLTCSPAMAEPVATPSRDGGQYIGEGIPTVAMRLENYTYISPGRLIRDIRAAGTPGSVDIRPAYVPAEDLLAVRAALPETDVFCETDVLGVSARTTDRSLDIQKREVTDIDALCALLECFPALERIDMCDCGLTNEQMETLCGRYPDIRFVWRVRFGSWSLRTDATAFSTLNSNTSPRYTSEEYSVLRYCTDLMALDLGHNRIADLAWLGGLTELRVLILADNDIVDISPLAGLEKLEYIELFMNDITDISALAGLTNLLDLNLCHNHIADGSPLYGLSGLERLWFSYNEELSAEQADALASALPECVCNFTIFYSTHAGWRGHDRYFVIKQIFAKGAYLPWDAEVPRE